MPRRPSLPSGDGVGRCRDDADNSRTGVTFGAGGGAVDMCAKSRTSVTFGGRAAIDFADNSPPGVTFAPGGGVFRGG